MSNALKLTGLLIMSCITGPLSAAEHCQASGPSEKQIGKLSAVAFAAAEKLGVHISFSVADDKGWPLYFKRDPEAMLVTSVLVPNKSYTSAILKMPTGDLAALTKPGAPLYGLNTADPKIILFAGGYPLSCDGKIVGAFGVGGGSWEQDEAVGKAVNDAFQSM